MKIGVSSAQGGRLANPAAVHAAAVAMEQVGYSSIWVRERAPTPSADYGSLDAIAVLAAIAMVTTRVALGATLAVDHDTSPPPWLAPSPPSMC
jgi:alkanesulfonate monooxygenase SsuD/methylene tetrahydromethanopterin reductase-like flavin-dependent oxidoreductase (luciferase family)